MKRIMIAGYNSFLGNNVEKILTEKGFVVDVVDMIGDEWKTLDLSIYDAVVNVCAIVHRPNETDRLFFDVNRDLAFLLAKKAKEAGVSHFIHISTNGVFGIDRGVISEKSTYKPKNAYEKSKYEGDCLISELDDQNYCVSIIRPPLLYGRGCKGNFPKIEKYAREKHFFPKFDNKKDFLYVKNLAYFILFLIQNHVHGLCYPRNSEVISTYRLVKAIALENNNKMHLIRFLNPFVFVFVRIIRAFKLVFGDNSCTIPICEKSEGWVEPYSFDDSIKDMYNDR